MLGFTQLLITFYLLHHGMITARPLSPSEALVKRGLGGAPPPCSPHRVLTKRMKLLDSKALASASDSAEHLKGASATTADGLPRLVEDHTVVTHEPPTATSIGYRTQKLTPEELSRFAGHQFHPTS
ncbi:hypothetical protein PTTG_26361 [Puccinia triticina 1-1 BBBD Race 1]|uniref:Uncharacterized protein n=1 Tax=Puccinia triticina (isolate 1-1 / race 1 (BBBD)) TaxID=630390 RepID=A0A180GVF3_PUCT1|nr:hypothetical protein PTTG_26361 [Puccinia triticina 1-1 BBBD Race 1]